MPTRRGRCASLAKDFGAAPATLKTIQGKSLMITIVVGLPDVLPCVSITFQCVNNVRPCGSRSKMKCTARRKLGRAKRRFREPNEASFSDVDRLPDPGKTRAGAKFNRWISWTWPPMTLPGTFSWTVNGYERETSLDLKPPRPSSYFS